jgi:ElaB/YqjD/DUF883 family membrane-anchored ribosome-binding protein
MDSPVVQALRPVGRAVRRRERVHGMHSAWGMQDNRIESKPAHAPGPPRPGNLMTFVRHHPVVSVLGAAGVGLIGGPEIALGAVLGAGIAVMIDRRGGGRAVGDVVEASAADAAEGARHVRQRAREILDGAPEIVKQRARAVVQAVRGQIAPVPEPEQAPTHESSAQDGGATPSSAV